MKKAILLAGLVFGVAAGSGPSLSDEWQTVHPGGETQCALGDDYSFHLRDTGSSKLLVFLNGGGACWSGNLCSPEDEPTPYVPRADVPHNDPRTRDGIFALDRDENPFRDWSMVFVSYCTGDVHLGGGDVRYEREEGAPVTIGHRGHLNATTALNAAFAMPEEPRTVFMTGSSAGALAAPVYADIVAQRFPEARIAVLADGAGGYRGEAISSAIRTWRVPEVLPYETGAPEAADGWSFEDFFAATARRRNGIRFAQYNTAHDEAQKQFLSLMGASPEALPDHQSANFAAIAASTGHFRYYRAGGAFHTILRFPQFYTYSVSGTAARDWIAAFADGDTVATVDCMDEAGCDAAPDPS